jgi:ABC-type nitrate/sulfonate/bicarbonate transport system ATPase subunit
VIAIRNLAKQFPARTKGAQPVDALVDVDLTIRDHEFVTLLGPSGCGKTTLLRMVAGLETLDSGGTIEVDGEPVTGPSPKRAMVFQSFALMPWANVLTNIAFGLELQGRDKKERLEVARGLAATVGLTGFEEHLPAQLSGGMQQRVGLARALAVEPDVLLMDEPFGALDEQTKKMMQEELLRIWEKDRITVLFVTHSIDEAILLGDRVVVMSPRPGRIDEIFDIGLPRPRSHADESDAEFVRIRGVLWDRIRGMHVDANT